MTTVNTAGSAVFRRDRLWLWSVVLSLVGMAVSGYLSYTKLTNSEIACIQGVTNCEVVNSSQYAFIAGIYVGYIGLAGYAAILAALLFESRVAFFQARGRLIVAAMTFFGFLFSGYLTAIEAFVLNEWCQWCVISAITMTALFVISLIRMGQVLPEAVEEEAG